jgi:hypothetical protein
MMGFFSVYKFIEKKEETDMKKKNILQAVGAVAVGRAKVHNVIC